MTNDKIRIAIAESCGWKMFPAGPDSFGVHCEAHATKEHVGILQKHLPDYSKDLNAINQAVLGLSAVEVKDKDGFDWSPRCEFLRQLEIIVYRDSGIKNSRIQFELINATARQRAEAFLRVIGKWKEEPLNEHPLPIL